jgi:hypothetical protein
VQHAVRIGDWKLAGYDGLGTKLYNLKTDISETTDLSAKNPDKFKELTEAYDKWNASNVKPLWPIKPEPDWVTEGW